MSNLNSALANRRQSNSPATMVKSLMNSEAVHKRFVDVMGEKAPQFMASITNLVNSSQQLQDVDAMSVISSAMVAATLDLPIDPNLGYMYIVPYNEKNNGAWLKRAQPQMGYRGYIQLALRTGQYKSINARVVHEGEITDWDPFAETYTRGEKTGDEVIGFMGHFELINGFQKTTFWTVEEMDEHRKKYSKSGNYNGQRSGVWKSNFEAMAIKTVIRNLLSKWGIMSIQMQTATERDEKPQTVDMETGELQDVTGTAEEEPNWNAEPVETGDPDVDSFNRAKAEEAKQVNEGKVDETK